MAIFTAISEKTQTATAMKRVLDYVMQDKKTVLDDVKLVSGQNCVPESAYQEFMATKHSYGKASGVFFKQYVQSFKPDCHATPQQIHEIGMETAKLFEGFEVVVATHIDKDHWHNHFVVNSVNCETGYKIQVNEEKLEQLRHQSDEICQRFGLETLKPYEKPKQRAMNQKEYRTALRGDSKKLRLMNAIDHAVAHSRNKRQFIDRMEKLGYGVKWIDHYRYITYTTPDGQRFRDNRLLEDKYGKRNMEELFAYGYDQTETEQSHREDHQRNRRYPDRTDTAPVPASDNGAVQQDSGVLFHDWADHCAEHGFDIRVAHLSGYERHDCAGDPAISDRDANRDSRQAELNRVFHQGSIIEADDNIIRAASKRAEPDDEPVESTRFDTVEAPAEMDRDWSDIAIDGLYLAADLAMIGETDDEDSQKSKNVRERRNGQKKNDRQSGGLQMKM